MGIRTPGVLFSTHPRNQNICHFSIFNSFLVKYRNIMTKNNVFVFSVIPNDGEGVCGKIQWTRVNGTIVTWGAQ